MSMTTTTSSSLCLCSHVSQLKGLAAECAAPTAHAAATATAAPAAASAIDDMANNTRPRRHQPKRQKTQQHSTAVPTLSCECGVTDDVWVCIHCKFTACGRYCMPPNHNHNHHHHHHHCLHHCPTPSPSPNTISITPPAPSRSPSVFNPIATVSIYHLAVFAAKAHAKQHFQDTRHHLCLDANTGH